jgi:hypothetical protein
MGKTCGIPENECIRFTVQAVFLFDCLALGGERMHHDSSKLREPLHCIQEDSNRQTPSCDLLISREFIVNQRSLHGNTKWRTSE